MRPRELGHIAPSREHHIRYWAHFPHRLYLYAPFSARKSSINVYMGNNNALSALIRCDSNAAIVADMDATLWRAVRRFGIYVWLGKVSSKHNISDQHTRSKEAMPFLATWQAPYKDLFTMLSMVKRAHSDIFKESDCGGGGSNLPKKRPS